MNVKTSAHYQREYRRRLREQGLVKKEIWIRPEHADKARVLERELRDNEADEANRPGTGRPSWHTAALFQELLECPLVKEGRASIELIEGVDPTLHIVMHDYGDLPEFLTVAGEQIIVESVMWPVSYVRDLAGFNETVLRTHKYFPLSTICLSKRSDDDYYLMFGAVSSSSDVKDVVHEIEALASNVIQATEAYADFLIPRETSGQEHSEGENT